MPARLAYPFLYAECVRRLGEESRIEVDALLGDPAAKAEMAERRMSAVHLMDADIG